MTSKNADERQQKDSRFRCIKLLKKKEANTFETAIEIIASKQPVTDLFLCRYLSKRRIAKDIGDRYCNELFTGQITKIIEL